MIELTEVELVEISTRFNASAIWMSGDGIIVPNVVNPDEWRRGNMTALKEWWTTRGINTPPMFDDMDCKVNNMTSEVLKHCIVTKIYGNDTGDEKGLDAQREVCLELAKKAFKKCDDDVISLWIMHNNGDLPSGYTNINIGEI